MHDFYPKKGISMPAKLRLVKNVDYSAFSLGKLCGMVENSQCAYDTAADFIEDKAFTECDNGRYAGAVKHLTRLAIFFEEHKDKNEETDRDLADIYLLLGDMCLMAEKYQESRDWFEKAAVVDDNYDLAFHCLAGVCLRLGDEKAAIRALEQEIHISPGNYYSYLQLADIFEKQREYTRFTEVLERLLSRDNSNIRALHRLIKYHEHASRGSDVVLLRRRLLNAEHDLVKMELVIWTYHMCRVKRFEDALRFLENHEQEKSGLILTRLLKAHIYACLRQYSRKRQELATFVRMCSGNVESIKQRLREFSSVFGDKEAERLHVRLNVPRAKA
jgi:tetratricopeptide (TPR) repeat protein